MLKPRSNDYLWLSSLAWCQHCRFWISKGGALPVKGSSVSDKPPYTERTSFIPLWKSECEDAGAAFWPGKVKGQGEIRGTEATGCSTDHFWEQKDCRLLAANFQNGCPIKYPINISASSGPPLCECASRCNRTPRTSGPAFPLTSPDCTSRMGPQGHRKWPISASKCQSSGQRKCLCSLERRFKLGWNDHINSLTWTHKGSTCFQNSVENF